MDMDVIAGSPGEPGDLQPGDGQGQPCADGAQERRGSWWTRMWERLLVGGLPIIPKGIVKAVASRYVAGATLDDAVATVTRLNAGGLSATLDVLGEEASTREEAAAVTGEYLRVLDAIEEQGLDSGVSVKLTSLGLRFDEALCQQNLERIARRARDLNNFVRIDMEDHSATDAALRVYRALQPRLGNLGVVLQAMLRRTRADVAALIPLKGDVRLCKGIYREPPALAYQDPEEIRQSYRACLDALLAGGCRVGIATHDAALVDAAQRRVAGVPREQYEFQMLLGVLPGLRQSILDAGHRLRVYVPFGDEWYAYSMRRLRENPDVAKHVMRAMFHP